MLSHEGLLIHEELQRQERRPAWLAKKLGLRNRAGLHHWMHGNRPLPENRRVEIALALGKPRDWLRPAEAMEPAA